MDPMIISIMSIVGATLDVIGKIMIAYTAIQVHMRFKEEHKIDELVFTEMEHEKRLGYIGVGLLVVGYVLQLPHKIWI